MSFVDVLKKAYPFLTVAAQFVPGGNIAGTVLGQVLKLKEGDTIDTAALAAINAPPEVKAQLQAEENRHQEALKAMNIQSAEEYEQLFTQDRADARQMQVATKSRTMPALAWMAVAMLVGCIYLVGFRTLPDTGHDAMLMLLGAVIAIYKDVYGYFFGSSAGSDAKTAIIANQNGGK